MTESTLNEETNSKDITSIKNDSDSDKSKKVQKNYDKATVELSKTKFILVIVALIVSLIMSSLDISIVVTALPIISKEFNAYDNYTWVITAYMLGNTTFHPMFGKFADIFGRRPVMIFSLVLFVASSFLCGASSCIEILIICRGFQGLSGGGIVAMVNIIISDIVPLKKRGGYMGLAGAVFAFSSVVGPLIGGFFTDHISWRWAFYVNAPIGIVAIIVISLFVNIPIPPGSLAKKIKRIDFLGTIILILSLVCLLLGLSWGGIDYEWSSPVIILLFVGFALLMSLYIFVEYKVAKEPITPLDLFKYRNSLFPCLVSFFLGFAFLCISNTLPLLYQDGRGISATYSGLRMTPSSITLSIATIGSGILIGKYGHLDLYMKSGALLLVISTILTSLIGMNTPYIYEFFIFILFGTAVGLNMQNCVLAIQQATPEKYLAICTTIISFFRIIGGAIGVSLFGSILQNQFPKYYQEEYPNSNVTVNDIHSIKDGEIIYVSAIQSTYRYTVIPSAVVAFIFSLCIKHIYFGNKEKHESKKEEMIEKNEENCIEIEINTKPE